MTENEIASEMVDSAVLAVLAPWQERFFAKPIRTEKGN